MNTRLTLSLVSLLTIAALCVGCGESSPEAAVDVDATFELSSPAFEDGGPIPVRYTCDGEDVSPPLEWRGLPPGVLSLALVVDDPDAVEVAGKVWDHWVLYNVPVRATSLAEGVPDAVDLAGGAHNGRGTAMLGYQGPCPPPGRTHTYRFRMYAVDTVSDLPGGATRQQLMEAIAGHVLAIGELTGTYSRR
jgi:Raf kinase inhibitor-like YbhB/YbcL family protein